MRVREYDAFVRKTSQFSSKPRDEQRSIALYGLVGEIGSLVAAVKKKILAEGGEETGWDHPNDEIIEELGDTLWYCFSLAQVVNDSYFDFFAAGIAALRSEVNSEDEHAQKIATSLKPAKLASFLEAAKSFPPAADYTFDDYQKLAFKTARTDGRILLEVSLALLWQLSAELLRATLPKTELALNRNIADRSPNIVLGEIAWYLAAITSLYDLSLNGVVEENQKKVRFRSDRGPHTALHDEDRGPKEQFPRTFDVAFICVGPGKSRMYVDGKQLGDDVTDNSYADDGYRFHDVIHLALVAYLGWSPVVRGFMKRKRKSRDDHVDEVEDGGRAAVVEEVVIKAIHSEGDKQAKTSGRCILGAPTRLFPNRSLINFRLLKTLRMYVSGLEVDRNAYWEWEDAIFHGCDMFYQLSIEKQGTVHVDLVARKLTFSPTVSPAIRGLTVGLGMGSANPDEAAKGATLNHAELEWASERGRVAETIAAKRAILDALGLNKHSVELCTEIEVRLDAAGRVYVKNNNSVQRQAWALRAIDYKVAFSTGANETICTANAVADVCDVSK
jgi:NTP pyrophosphatase (non-canonical NTP hydrolase)